MAEEQLRKIIAEQQQLLKLKDQQYTELIRYFLSVELNRPISRESFELAAGLRDKLEKLNTKFQIEIDELDGPETRLWLNELLSKTKPPVIA